MNPETDFTYLLGSQHAVKALRLLGEYWHLLIHEEAEKAASRGKPSWYQTNSEANRGVKQADATIGHGNWKPTACKPEHTYTKNQIGELNKWWKSTLSKLQEEGRIKKDGTIMLRRDNGS